MKSTNQFFRFCLLLIFLLFYNAIHAVVSSTNSSGVDSNLSEIKTSRSTHPKEAKIKRKKYKLSKWISKLETKRKSTAKGPAMVILGLVFILVALAMLNAEFFLLSLLIGVFGVLIFMDGLEKLVNPEK